jgi:ElaB/YqjD/DUF883 family membrane-anchored ribosome-binding protein
MIQRGNGRSRAAQTGMSRLPSEPPPPLRNERSLGTHTETLIAEHPVACIAAALLLGVTLGWLIKRR